MKPRANPIDNEFSEAYLLLNFQSASTRLLYATVRVHATLKDGSESVGTGFQFVFDIDKERDLPVLVTNKHVVRSAVSAEFHLHECSRDAEGKIDGPGTRSFPVTLNDFENRWFMHPDPEVDLCVMPLWPLQNAAKRQGKDAFIAPLPDSLIPKDDVLIRLCASEEVLMVGYPTALWDNVNNFPILRRGHTASHPATNFQGRPEGVVDMACFPGSSGSPILIVNEGAHMTPMGMTLGDRVLLLGILYAGPVFRADGSVHVVAVPTKVVAVASTDIPTHLGYYVKSSQLEALKPILLSEASRRS